MATKTVQDSSLTLVADAIRAKGGTSAQLEFPTDFVSAIQNIPTGGGGGSSATPKDVNFYDYDGTLTNSYTASEFAALSAMPANPSHTGLTAQGWNWSLANAKTYVAKYGRLNIGQMYVTTSGDTEIDIQLSIGRNKPYLGCCPNGTVEIDWGDGSAHDTLTGTSTTTLKSIQHTYPDTGEMFTIKLHMKSGSLGFIGNSSSSTGSQVLYNGTTGQTNGQRAYQNAVKKVRFGSHVTSIYPYVFDSCYSLTSITISNSVTSIPSYAFHYCYALESVTIPDSVTYIGSYAFFYCYTLESVTIPDSVTSISSYAFYYCKLLASITMPNSINNIENYCFGSCYTLESVTIPDSVTSIGTNAFQNCDSLASVMIPDRVTSIEKFAFNNCSALTSIIIPDGVTSIGANAFNFCSALASVVIPDGVTSIGSSAFNGCYSLTSITIPDSVTNINSAMFQDCYSLASIMIPDGVTSIGSSTFLSCYSLASITFEPTVPPTVAASSAFKNLPSDLVVYVPAGTLATYQNATNYTNIASYMQEKSV